MSRIVPTAEPFFFSGGDTACLLVHGFTGTPKEMRLLGESLASRGCTVLGLRLAGHATRLEDMARMRRQDWLADVESAYWLLRPNARRLIVMGLSMGGILALTFASQVKVDGLVVMSTPHHLPNDPRVPFLVPLSWVQPYKPKEKPVWCDMDAYQEQASYRSEPVRSMAEVRDLLVEMRAGLGQVRCPALLIYSRSDPSVCVSDGHAEAIYAALGSRQKEIRWLEKSGHVVTRDCERETVFGWVGEFAAAISGDSGLDIETH